jgi:large conductance mechanosensitive channel
VVQAVEGSSPSGRPYKYVMNSFFQEFKTFALRGNVLDLAVGVVIGAAFNSIVNSLVTNVLTPPLGLLTGNVDFKDLVINLGGTVRIEYGLFIQAVISFGITAFALFLFVRFMNRVVHKARTEESKPEEKSPELCVLEEIRDELQRR